MGSEDSKNKESDLSLHRQLEIVLRSSSFTWAVETAHQGNSNDEGGAIESGGTSVHTQPCVQDGSPSPGTIDNFTPVQKPQPPPTQPQHCSIHTQPTVETLMKTRSENTQTKIGPLQVEGQRYRTGRSIIVHAGSDTAQALGNLYHNEFDLGYLITKQALESRNSPAGNRITGWGDDLAGIGMRFENATGVN